MSGAPKLQRSASCPAAITSTRQRNAQDAAIGCFSWPPPVDWTVRYGAAAVGIIAVPAALTTLWSRTTSHGETRQQWSQEELGRREKKLAELMHRARASMHQANSPVRSRDLLESIQEVVQLNRSHEELAAAVLLTCQVILWELPDATQRTAQGEDEEFRDGTELAKHLRNIEQLFTCARRSKMVPHDHVEVWQKLKEVRVLARIGERTLWTLRNKDLGKALKLIWIAHKDLPWIAVSSILSTFSGILRTAELYYRAESLEVFRDPLWTWGVFRRTTWALAFTKMMIILMDIVKERIHTLGEKRMSNTYRMELYKSLLHKDLEWYRIGQKDARNPQALIHDIYCLPEDVQQFLAIPRQLMEDLANIITQVAIVRRRSSSLLYALIAIQWTTSALQEGIKVLKDRFLTDLRDASPKPDMRTFEEPLSAENLPTVKSFGYEDKAAKNWGAYWESEAALDQNLGAVREVFQPFEKGLEESAGFAERGWCGRLLQDGRLHVGDMMNLQAYAQDVSYCIKKIPQQFFGIRDKLRPLASAWDLLQAGSLIKSGSFVPRDHNGSPSRAIGSLKFEAVEFSYPDGTQVLRDITFEVQRGMTIGITGTSGGGKSTLFKLLERLYDPIAGTIMLDGRNILDYDIHWLRRQIALVPQPQNLRLLTMSLRENLTIGCEKDPSEVEVQEACQAACIWDELIQDNNRLPNGLYTHVTADRFSGGELQRIAVARALLTGAPVLLMDEATSALDAETQRKVQASLLQLFPRRTMLVIAHRLETIRNADKIISLHAGMVAEEGTHDELVDKSFQVFVNYPSQAAFALDVTTAAGDTSFVRIEDQRKAVITHVRKGGLADLSTVRPGFEVIRTQENRSGYNVGFRGLGVYAELYRRPPEGTADVIPTMQPVAESRHQKGRTSFLERLHRAEAALMATVNLNDEPLTDNVEAPLDVQSLQALRVALQDVQRTISQLSSSDDSQRDLPKSKL